MFHGHILRNTVVWEKHVPGKKWKVLVSWGLRRLLGGASGKEPACSCRKCKSNEFNPWVGKILWRRAWQPTPVFLPGESPWTEEPGGLRSIRSQRVRHDWSDLAHSTHQKGLKNVGRSSGCQDSMFGGLSHDCELPRSEVPSYSLWVPQSVQPGPSWRCLLLTARTDHIIYDHHPSFLRQPIPQEVLESFFSLNDLFFFFFLLSFTQSCRDFISSMKSY